MMALKEYYTLENDVKVPKIGFGTWLIDDETAAECVQQALERGYRHVDTAQAYGNEAGVGRAIAASGIDRDSLFVTSKIAAELKSYDEAAASIDESLEKLGLDTIDLMIIHSPKPWSEFKGDDRFFEGNLETWRALEDAYDDGKVRAIGVSNFEQEDLANIIEHGRINPMVNQVLAHIRNTPHQLIEFCNQNGVLVEAYSPFGHGEILNDDTIAAVAETYGVSVPQLCVRYGLELGLVSLPKSTNPDHMESNAAVDFHISAEDMDTLANLDPLEDYGEAGKFPVYAN